MDDKTIRQAVRDRYGSIARQGASCCAQSSSCCGDPAQAASEGIGYSAQEMGSVPNGANLGLGCGNPLALAAINAGDTVLDLGSGGGFDCFLAAQRVGPEGRVIGVDMTPDMLEKARDNAGRAGYENVEFRLGEIENLPVADSSVDLITSNCVVNLSTRKSRVFEEALRVLAPGGRLMISDIVLDRELPEEIRSSLSAYAGCVAGALLKQDYLEEITRAGFTEVEVLKESSYGCNSSEGEAGEDSPDNPADNPGDDSVNDSADIAGRVLSISVSARKPDSA